MGIIDYLKQPSRPNSFTRWMGERIREARQERGLSQEELARNVGRSRPAISQMETGKMEPDASTLLSLALHLRKPLVYFFPPTYTTSLEPKVQSVEAQELLVLFDRLDEELQQVVLKQVRALVEYVYGGPED